MQLVSVFLVYRSLLRVRVLFFSSDLLKDLHFFICSFYNNVIIVRLKIYEHKKSNKKPTFNNKRQQLYYMGKRVASIRKDKHHLI